MHSKENTIKEIEYLINNLDNLDKGDADVWLMFNIFTWYKYRTYFYKCEIIQEKLRVTRDLFRELNIEVRHGYPCVLAEDENLDFVKQYMLEFFEETNFSRDFRVDVESVSSGVLNGGSVFTGRTRPVSTLKCNLGENVEVILKRFDDMGFTGLYSVYSVLINKREVDPSKTNSVAYTFPLLETFTDYFTD